MDSAIFRWPGLPEVLMAPTPIIWQPMLAMHKGDLLKDATYYRRWVTGESAARLPGYCGARLAGPWAMPAMFA